MAVRVILVSDSQAAGSGDWFRQMLPPAACLVLRSASQIAAGDLADAPTIFVFLAETPAWRDDLAQLMASCCHLDPAPLVLALVPRADPDGLAAAFRLRVADAAGLPIDPHEVRARLGALLRRQRQALAAAATSRAAWQLAVSDPVTGLHNRHYLDQALPAAILAARASMRPLAVLMIDIDDLKPFNDRWGHAAGDRALRCVADAVRSGLRAGDIIARVGGDEIAVVLPDTAPETARALAARLVAQVARTKVGTGQAQRLTISVGTAMMAIDDDGEALLARADAALYAAKRTGRNRVSEAAAA